MQARAFGVQPAPPGERALLRAGQADLLNPVQDGVAHARLFRLQLHRPAGDAHLRVGRRHAQHHRRKDDCQRGPHQRRGEAEDLRDVQKGHQAAQSHRQDVIEQHPAQRADGPGAAGQLAGGIPSEKAHRQGQQPHHHGGFHRLGGLGMDALHEQASHQLDQLPGEGAAQQKHAHADHQVQIVVLQNLARDEAVHLRLDHAHQRRDQRRQGDQDQIALGNAVLHIHEQVRDAQFFHGQGLIKAQCVPGKQLRRLLRHACLPPCGGVLEIIAEHLSRQQGDSHARFPYVAQHGAVGVAEPVVLQLHVAHHQPRRAQGIFQLLGYVRDVFGYFHRLLAIVFQDVVDGLARDQALVLQALSVPLVHDHAGHAKERILQHVLVALAALFDLFVEPTHLMPSLRSGIVWRVKSGEGR